ncbi:hypothetical protein STEG23_015620 [Scotinomys teguina]
MKDIRRCLLEQLRNKWTCWTGQLAPRCGARGTATYRMARKFGAPSDFMVAAPGLYHSCNSGSHEEEGQRTTDILMSINVEPDSKWEEYVLNSLPGWHWAQLQIVQEAQQLRGVGEITPLINRFCRHPFRRGLRSLQSEEARAAEELVRELILTWEHKRRSHPATKPGQLTHKPTLHQPEKQRGREAKRQKPNLCEFNASLVN